MIKYISYQDKQIAILVKNSYRSKGIDFLTEDSLPQQIACMYHNKGDKVKAHIHNVVKREIFLTQETLIIRKGKVRLDLYSDNKEYCESVILNDGDVIILISGGHGLTFLEETDMIEIKQGPYLGANDKVQINEAKDEEIKISA